LAFVKASSKKYALFCYNSGMLKENGRRSTSLEAQPNGRFVTMPKPIEIYTRQPGIPQQEPFSRAVDWIDLALIHADLRKGHLANFLRQFNNQHRDESKKIGIIFLVNDNAKDAEPVRRENHLVADYLTLLSMGNVDAIRELPVSQEYKEVAQEIIDKDMLEIRTDFIHSSQPDVHWGKLRRHNMHLLGTFKNPDVPDTAVKVHISDVDATYPVNYFRTLDKAYEDDAIETNFARIDFLPWIQEGDFAKDVGRASLLHFDAYRLFKFTDQVGNYLNGQFLSSAPTMSARFSWFFQRYDTNETKRLALRPHYTRLDHHSLDEDYTIGQHNYSQPQAVTHHHVYTRDTDTSILRTRPIEAHAGKVLLLHRLRPVADADMEKPQLPSDSERAYVIAKSKQYEGKFKGRRYNLLSSAETDAYITNLETEFAQQHQMHDFAGFRRTQEYQDIFAEETRMEARNVLFRRRLLMKYLSKRHLEPLEERMMYPFEYYFPEEKRRMQELVDQGFTAREIADQYFTNKRFASFFDSQDPIHTQIARTNALMRYAQTNTDIIEDQHILITFGR